MRTMQRTYVSVIPAKVSVIPAKAGIQKISSKCGYWIPAFAGMTQISSNFALKPNKYGRKQL